MKHLLTLAALLCSGCFAQDYAGSEIVSGTLHVIWTRQDLSIPEPNNPAHGLWISLHSDDDDTTSFRVTLRYRMSGGNWQSVTRHVDNTTGESGSTYWVSSPTQCIFWITLPGWPTSVEYSVIEEKHPRLRVLAI